MSVMNTTAKHNNKKPLEQRYTREQAFSLLETVTNMGTLVTDATTFPANPSRSTCRFCDFAEDETCEYRYAE